MSIGTTVNRLKTGQKMGPLGNRGKRTFGRIRRTRTLHLGGEQLEPLCLMAADASLVQDVNQAQQSVTEVTSGFFDFPVNTPMLTVNGKVYFSRTTREAGNELWVSDGTSEGTRLVKDIVPGAGSSAPIALTLLNEDVVFVANNAIWKTDGTEAGTVKVSSIAAEFNAQIDWVSPMSTVNGAVIFSRSNVEAGAYELWRTDGTSQGTFPLKADFTYLDSLFLGRVEVQGSLYFSGTDAQHGAELWKTDGTIAGTVLVKDIVPGPGSSGPAFLAESNGRLFFWAANEQAGIELWKSDGTAAGTEIVKDSIPGPDGLLPLFMTDVNGTVFFSGLSGEEGRELWKSDGTETGTTLVRDILPFVSWSEPKDLIAYNGLLYFSANSPAGGRELWRSDGTSAGTTQVSNLAAPNGFSTIGNLVAGPGGIYFYGNSDGAWGLWRSDGSPAGTTLLRNFDSIPTRLTPLGDQLIFTVGELWKTDGTAAGTVAISESRTADVTVRAQVAFRGKLYFLVDDESLRGLWRTDGTDAGTRRVRAFDSLVEMIVFNDQIYFTASDGTQGFELWQSDGTETGTKLVTDLVPGSEGSNVQQLRIVGDSLVFIASTPQTGQVLWKIQANSPSVTQVSHVRPDPLSSPLLINDRILYTTPLDSTGELWATDGTLDGNVRLSGNAPQQLVAGRNELYFMTLGLEGIMTVREVWKSDGTPAGTMKVPLPTPADPGNFFPNVLGVAGDTLLILDSFTGDLWASDASGVRRAHRFLGPFGPAYIGATIIAGDRLYLTVWGDKQSELWQSDGTVAGTVPVADRSASQFDRVSFLGEIDGTLYFYTNREDQFYIYQTDGTPAGTRPVSGAELIDFSSITTLHRVDKTLYVVANDRVSGEELWAITADGIQLVADISAGSTASLPSVVVPVDDRLFVLASDSRYGREFWRIDREGTVPNDDRDGNGQINIDDLNLWCAAVRSGDATHDELAGFWQRHNTGPGDVNFDRQFDSSDLVLAFQRAKYETGADAAWSEGDWNCDGAFDSSDLVLAFVQGWYEKGPRGARVV